MNDEPSGIAYQHHMADTAFWTVLHQTVRGGGDHFFLMPGHTERLPACRRVAHNGDEEALITFLMHSKIQMPLY